jgi:hypothetical protein
MDNINRDPEDFPFVPAHNLDNRVPQVIPLAPVPQNIPINPVPQVIPLARDNRLYQQNNHNNNNNNIAAAQLSQMNIRLQEMERQLYRETTSVSGRLESFTEQDRAKQEAKKFWIERPLINIRNQIQHDRLNVVGRSLDTLITDDEGRSTRPYLQAKRSLEELLFDVVVEDSYGFEVANQTFNSLTNAGTSLGRFKGTFNQLAKKKLLLTMDSLKSTESSTFGPIRSQRPVYSNTRPYSSYNSNNNNNSGLRSNLPATRKCHICKSPSHIMSSCPKLSDEQKRDFGRPN